MRIAAPVFTLIPVFLCWMALSTTGALAQSAETGFGALARHLPDSGQDDGWRVVNTGDSFEIENIGNPQAIRYYFVGPAQGREGRRRIEAAVSIHPDSTGSAGLLYGLNEARDVYHMVTLDAQGMLRVFRRDADGFRPMIEQSSDAYVADGMNLLALQENGDEVSFSLNGREMGSIGGDLFGRGGTGLGLVGDVRAFYTYFSDAG